MYYRLVCFCVLRVFICVHADPRECDALAAAYTACLAADGVIGGRASPSTSLETILSPPNNEADVDFMTLHTVLIGAGTDERKWEGEDGAVRVMLVCLYACMHRYVPCLATDSVPHIGRFSSLIWSNLSCC